MGEQEVWKLVNSLDNLYEISNQGRIRSLDRWSNNNGTLVLKKGRILKGRLHSGGYIRVNICINNKNKDYYIHRLVAKEFLDNYSEDLVINHKDGNKKNNSVNNLECVTQKENLKHARETGLNNAFGENHYCNKLTNEDVRAIKILNESGLNGIELSKKFGVARSVISRIINGKVWKHVC